VHRLAIAKLNTEFVSRFMVVSPVTLSNWDSLI
jgi:hypothetical protein